MTASPVTKAAIEAVLAEFKDPETGRGVVEMDQIHDLRFDEATKSLSLTLALATHSAPLWNETQAELAAIAPAPISRHQRAQVNWPCMSVPPEKLGQMGLTAKSVIAVGSGKGGVGKSTIAACLALGLKRAGARSG